MENKPKHTPGPWRESMDGEIQSDTYRICNPFLNSGMVPKIEEQEANAALIAAAPELLEACRIAVDEIQDGVCTEVMAVLKSAISKAEGK